jgi:hypothetical protein
MRASNQEKNITMRSFITLIAFCCLLLISCSKTSPSNNNNNNRDSTMTTASKVMVETYVGKTIANSISGPGSMCIDQTGYLYVAETDHNVIIKIDPLLQTVGNFAGLFNTPGCTDDPFGSGAPSLTFPENIWVGSDQQICIGDYGCGKAKIATTTGEVASLGYKNPYNLYPSFDAVCKDNVDNIFIMDTYDGLYEVREQDQVLVNLLSGNDLGIASSMTTDADQTTIYIAAKQQIFGYSSQSLHPIAGDSIGNKDGVGGNASFGGAMSICAGTDGNIYVADINNNTIRQVTPNGMVTTIAGDGKDGYVDVSGDKAEFSSPRGIAFTTSGDNNVLFVSDYNNSVIRKITFPKK